MKPVVRDLLQRQQLYFFFRMLSQQLSVQFGKIQAFTALSVGTGNNGYHNFV
jgi:hypothetical protein